MSLRNLYTTAPRSYIRDYQAQIQLVVRVGLELGVSRFQVQRLNHLATVHLAVSISCRLFFSNRKPRHYAKLCSFPLPTIGEDAISGLINASSSSSFYVGNSSAMYILYFVYLPLNHHKELEMRYKPSSASLGPMIIR